MNPQLAAEFEKRFAADTIIRVAMRRPSEGFSVTALFGPSGCGKTTALRCLAGLDRPEVGRIEFGHHIWFDAGAGVFLPPRARGVSLLFQDYALFPHLTVEANVGYGLASISTGDRRRRLGEMLDRFSLHGLERRYPHQLSGGQQQRVALARAVARRPRLLLLDEPLSALDGPTREGVRLELRSLLAHAAVPVMVVTHDVIEAVTLADYVLVMDGGRIRQEGTVEEVFSRPVDAAVARIVGVETVLRGRIVGVQEGMASIAVGQEELRVVAAGPLDGEVDLFIRAQDVALMRDQPAMVSVQNHLPGRVQAMIREGPLTRVIVDCGFPLTALITRRAEEELGLAPGDSIVASIKATAIHVVPRAGSR